MYTMRGNLHNIFINIVCYCISWKGVGDIPREYITSKTALT